MNIENPDLLDILKRILEKLENEKISTPELDEIYNKCENIYKTLLEKVFYLNYTIYRV